MASHNVQITLKEFCPLYYLYNNIPVKVQKGFRSVQVYLTALDTSSDYIAVGSSIGMLYLYCRHLSQMNKYNLEGKMEAITAVKLLSCFDDLVALGTASGRVAIFQLVSPLPGRNKQLRRFDVVGLHKSTVTALAWSANGMKLFSGDDKGKVIYSAVDLDQGTCTPKLLLEESSAIVQLEYSQKVLLLSSTQRSLLFYTQDDTLSQLGTKPRKSNGKFGACFHPALCKQSDILVYATRPGLRLWRADIQGSVQDTYLLKELFAKELPYFELFPHSFPLGGQCLPERQLGLITCFMKEDWVLSWNEYSVFVFDSLNQVIIGGIESCGDIVSVSCTENEIFILKGDRDIIRISNQPEGLASNWSELSFSPLANSIMLLPHSGAVETAEPIRTMTMISEQKEKGMDGKVQKENEEVEKQNLVEEEKMIILNKQFESEEDKQISSNLEHCSRSSSISGISEQSDLSSSRYSSITQEDLQQELVVKAIKVKRKTKRRRQESGNRISEHSSWSDGVFSQEDGSSEGNNTPVYEVESHCTSLNLESNGPADQGEIMNLSSQSSNPFNLLISPDPAPSLGCHSPVEMCLSGTPAPCCTSSCPPSQSSQGLNSHCHKEFRNNGQDLSLSENECCYDVNTPDVDSLLECTFSYTKTGHAPTEILAGPNLQISPNGNLVYTENSPENQAAYSSENLPQLGNSCEPELCVSSDEDDIYAYVVPPSRNSGLADTLQTSHYQSSRIKKLVEEEPNLHKSDLLAESWMGYSGPACGILSLMVTDKYIWCLDFKGGLYCSALPNDGLRWQKFEDNVQQLAVSPSGTLLWKVEQKTNKAFACGKVTIKGRRHWYEAQSQVNFVTLSDDSAWIISSNGDLFLQTGLSGDRPCARSVKVDSPCPLVQITARDSAVWVLSEQRGVFYREGLSSFCPEGERWKHDDVSERQGLEPVCISLGHQQTLWALDTNGDLWFRTGISTKKPRGSDEHWWQVSITDYVVFDQSSLLQTLIQATQSVATATKAPVEKVADRLRVAFWSQQPQCQLNLVSASSSGIWIASSRNDLHVARGNLIGTFWKSVLPRGTASTTKWAFVLASASSTKEGNFLWLGQNRKDLLCMWDRDIQLRPSTVQLPTEMEMLQLSACHDALWGIDIYGRIHIRTLSTSCPTGMYWTLLDLSQLGDVKLVSVSCGSQNVWACDQNGNVYFRVGTQPLNSSMMLPAWICIEPPEQPVGVHLVNVHTSPNDRMLWALDSRGNVHVRTGITEEMPVGTHWEHIPGLQASHLVLSVRTVWVRCPNGEIARRYGITDKNPAGDYWKKIPGQVSKLSVTPEDELWAISLSGSLICRLTKTLQHNVCNSKVSLGCLNDDLEEEWEVI
ncbi:tectonin beta-propeller repeat-containing protein 2 [Brienomyrus brachyistius]|uniref:tectonin beta-propeller repeat-containing protein 2 n=1 Tax=Brienomyrus brachyistius TaxID=42636 RepID=UPI0020B1D561|nr:tectonin beta-propeller repeat-containing protein 2 [Brienomyrus brachyistius]